ncbi:MAG: serine--tRNA ligase [Deltaproteobacteria bacterium]
MLDLKFISDQPEAVKKNAKSRGFSTEDIDKILDLNQQRKKITQEAEDLRSAQNKVSKEIAVMKKEKKDASSKMAEMKKVSERIKELSSRQSEIEQAMNVHLLLIPNLLDPTVPQGKGEEDNREIRKWGTIPKFNFQAKDHLTLGEKLGIIDVERAAKIAGSRFTIYKNLGARLERALINFMLDLNTKEGKYQEILPPFLVNPLAMQGTGQLPKFEGDLFRTEGGVFYLIPTAEVPLTNIYREEILEKEELPLCFTAYTPCFRKEAGSYGKDIKGLIRQHQFNKVEIVKIVEPEKSTEELETLTADAEKILKRLELPYRVVALCSADVGFSSTKTYDLEVWLPNQNRYREISSCSNCGDFQARRMNLRYRPGKGAKPRFPHTLNGSALAVGRTVIAILENFQREDGSISIPKALVPYLGTDVISVEEGWQSGRTRRS